MAKEINVGKYAVFLVIFSLGLFLSYYTFVRNNEDINNEINSFDHVKEEQISVFNDKVLIDLNGKKLSWSKFADTNSMGPFLDEEFNGLSFAPTSTDDIRVGDIVSFEFENVIFVHRVVETGLDDNGWYALTKGDNLKKVDYGKRRFNDIKSVYFGVIF